MTTLTIIIVDYECTTGSQLPTCCTLSDMLQILSVSYVCGYSVVSFSHLSLNLNLNDTAQGFIQDFWLGVNDPLPDLRKFFRNG